MYYQCLDCGFEFFEDEAEQEFSKQKAKKNKENTRLWTEGPILFFLIVVSALIINISNRAYRSTPSVELNENTEVLIQQWVR